MLIVSGLFFCREGFLDFMVGVCKYEVLTTMMRREGECWLLFGNGRNGLRYCPHGNDN